MAFDLGNMVGHVFDDPRKHYCKHHVLCWIICHCAEQHFDEVRSAQAGYHKQPLINPNYLRTIDITVATLVFANASLLWVEEISKILLHIVKPQPEARKITLHLVPHVAP